LRSSHFILAIVKWLVAAKISFCFDLYLAEAKRAQVDWQGFEEPSNYVVSQAQLARREAITRKENGQIVTLIDSRIDPRLWQSFIHHEYAHACQMTLGGPSASVFMDEASATLQEMLALGERGAWHHSVSDFQARPEIPPFIDLHDGTKFEYGGALFLLFLETHVGNNDGRFVSGLWRESARNLPHMNGADWARLIESRTTDLATLILEFTVFRQQYNGLKIFSVASNNIRELRLSQSDWPLPLGCLFVRVPGELTIRIEAEFPFGVREHDDTHAICNLDKEAFFLGDLSARSMRVFFDQKG